jgi:hypothetical protein
LIKAFSNFVLLKVIRRGEFNFNSSVETKIFHKFSGEFIISAESLNNLIAVITELFF